MPEAGTALAFSCASCCQLFGCPRTESILPCPAPAVQDALAEPPDADSYSRWDRPSPCDLAGARPPVFLEDLRF